jgi:hypothetical protein
LATPAQPVAAEPIVSVLIDGIKVTFDQPPVMINGRTMVPVRAILEALGYEVYWNESENTVMAIGAGNTITAQIDNPVITHSNGVYYCDVPPMIVSGRTLVPVRAISESAGCTVEWNNNTYTVTITTT